VIRNAWVRKGWGTQSLEAVAVKCRDCCYVLMRDSGTGRQIAKLTANEQHVRELHASKRSRAYLMREIIISGKWRSLLLNHRVARWCNG